MKKSIRYSLFILIILAACEKSSFVEQMPIEQDSLISKQEVQNIVFQTLKDHNEFRWGMVNDEVLWSAAMHSDSIFAIGYQPAGFQNIQERIHQIDINDRDWIKVRDEILDLILQGERSLRGQDLTIDDLLPLGYPEVLPTMAIRITNFNTIRELREKEEIRYLEAMGYYPDYEVTPRSSSGCGVSPNYNIPTSEYTGVAPNAKVPWNFYNHNIPSAWSQSTGDGVTVVIIDSGTSFGQNNLGSQFNSGYSQGRNVSKISTLYTGWWWWKSLVSADDDCGHGTQMAGMATGPRSVDGNSTGVAYNSDLLGIHAVNDVIISSSNEKDGVKNALITAGNNNNVRVISMSIGTIFWSGTVADGIYYAYNHGKMIMAAAGTSTTFTNWFGVIFPASMSQTVAITGVKEGMPLDECSTCHYGSAVDFVAVMQRNNNNDLTTLTLAPCCDQPTYVGGSSAATSMTAGVAALVWGKNPSLSRGQVMNILKNASQFYPARDSDFGWGMIDAASAVSAAN